MIELIAEGAMLKTVIIDISSLNKGDNIDEFISKTGYKVVSSLEDFDGFREEAFLITDSIRKKSIGKRLGIGCSIYLNDTNKDNSFSDVLYSIEALNDLSDTSILHMYERANNIPWTILETKRCIVREMTVDDLDELYAIYSDPDVKKYIEDLYEDREKELEFTISYINNQYRFFEYGMWIVVEKDSGKVIGRAGIFDRDGQDYSEVGFIFEKSYQGKGYAFEVMTKILEYAREELYKDRLFSFTMKENTRAKDLLLRLGFSYVKEETIDLGLFDKYEITLI